jgi:hypothetical protein
MHLHAMISLFAGLAGSTTVAAIHVVAADSILEFVPDLIIRHERRTVGGRLHEILGQEFVFGWAAAGEHAQQGAWKGEGEDGEEETYRADTRRDDGAELGTF